MANKKANLEFIREDDYVEYFLFPDVPKELLPSQQSQQQQEEETRQESQTEQDLREYLDKVLHKCNDIVDRYMQKHQYIWHKDEFKLQIRTGSEKERLLNDNHNDDYMEKATELPLPPHLYGVTHYGDNIADEWFMVYLLTQLTNKIPGCIVRVIDSDGEFLMIEAAEVLPKWANPDTCEQRVFIAGGHLQLVQNSPSNTSKSLPVPLAISKIRQNPTLYRVSKEIQTCITERFKEFANPAQYLHRQIVRLPLGVAALLKARPSLIAPAVRAFCDRDKIDLKVLRTMRYFPPEQCVRSNVVFTRCLYAMVMQNRYVPERKIGWKLHENVQSEEYKEDLLGVKIASGFEILASQAKAAQDFENEPAWRAYVQSLTAKGYFGENLEGSQEYKRKLEEAKIFYQQGQEQFRTASKVGKEILELLEHIDINADDLKRDDMENNLEPSDSDDWMTISAEQLDAMLLARYGAKTLYKSNGDIDATEFTKNIAEFLEKESRFDGIENDRIDDEDGDDDESLDSDDICTPLENQASGGSKQQKASKARSEEFKAKVKKNLSMRRACNDNSIMNSPPASAKAASASAGRTQKSVIIDSTSVKNFLDFVIPEDNWDTNSDMSDYEDEEDLERNIESMTKPEMNIDHDIKEYMAQMDRELAKTNVGRTFEVSAAAAVDGKNPSLASAEDDFDDIESFEPININVNTLKNMMDSYKSQLGGAGPVSNLLSAMGVGMSVAATAAAEVASDDGDDKVKVLSESTV